MVKTISITSEEQLSKKMLTSVVDAAIVVSSSSSDEEAPENDDVIITSDTEDEKGMCDSFLPIMQGRIIHEAGEAEASGPGPLGPGPPGTTKIYKVGPIWAPEFLEITFAVF